MFEGHPHFEIAAGSVSGRTHALSGRPNQDALVVRASASSLVAVVADGCGSAEHSEVGAWIGASTLAAELGRATSPELDDTGFWDRVQSSTLSALRNTATSMGGNLEDTVRRFFLFTVVGAVIAGDRAAVFSLGDGLIAVNGQVTHLGPFPGNAPPYVGYALFDDHRTPDSRLVIHHRIPAGDIESILVATDGATEWNEAANRPLPGTHETTGPLSQLWQDDRFFDHPDALRRKLARMNRALVRPVWDARRLEKEPGLLEDDTTIAVLRPRKRTARAAA
jgi:hypothetical protein